MVNEKQAIKALLREIASHELLLVPSMNKKVKDFGKLSKDMLELINKHTTEALTFAEKFEVFHILSKQMFETELMSNPRFEAMVQYLMEYYILKNMHEWANLSAELDIKSKWDEVMKGTPTDSDDPMKMMCIMCGKPLRECKCDKPKGYG